MKYSESIKSVSYLKSHTSEVIRDITDNHKTMIITQNGEAKVAVQDIKEYEEMQESLAILKILALSSENIRKQDMKPLSQAFEDISQRIKSKHNDL